MSADLECNRTMVCRDNNASVAAEQPQTVVAGYTLQERIGVGGYGEVWKAVGPGGLTKAVKILHGNFDDPAADAELKSLQLMRELRHPFLLNIERIEIDENRLVIVTELAECSLEDRFDELKRDGLKGIPRDELLVYLRDAADALDFMHQQHGLQHLDIKPGNLLIQGGHAKVADFGMIKDVRRAQVSMIGGFTPLYAPPELFEGEPSGASDQYSLGIVYQVMLTGRPPFAGRTAAQLTAQHLSSKPDLSLLTPADRSVIARALSKNPLARFPSCREFVDRLSAQRPGRSASSMARTAILAKAQPHATRAVASASHTSQKSTPRLEAVPRPPLALNHTRTVFRPTLIVGVGGLGGRVLLKLRERLATLSDQPLPAFPMLYLDSDSSAIESVSSEEFQDGLNSAETLAIPLRDPGQYRSGNSDVLDWLGRRWLYNIPRSRQVESLRPLGRLALVDHHDAVRRRLRNLVDEATSEEALRVSGERLGIDLDATRFDVFVIASISGGTGSGAVLDTAYLIRDVLPSLGIVDSSVTGILLHSTGQREPQSRIQRANSMSCLAELRRYSMPNLGYPGAAGCRLPECEQAPFDHSYLVQLGTGIPASEFEAGTADVAEYLIHQLTSDTRGYFDRLRSDSRESLDALKSLPTLRTFGVARLSDANLAARADTAVALSRALLKHWMMNAKIPREGRGAQDATIVEYNRRLLQKLELDVDQLVRKAIMVSQGAFGQQATQYFTRELDLENGDSIAFERIDEEFARTDASGLPSEHPIVVLSELRQQLGKTSSASIAQIYSRILELADHSPARLTVLCETVGDMLSQLENTQRMVAEMLEQTQRDRQQLVNQESLSTADRQLTGSAERHRAGCRNYITSSFCSGVLECLSRHLNELRTGLREQCSEMMQSATLMAMHEPATAEHLELNPLIQALNQKLLESGTLRSEDILHKAPPTGAVPAELKKRVLAFLADASTEVRGSLDTSNSESVVEQAQPNLSHVGGGRRILAVLPSYLPTADWQRGLERRFGNCVTLSVRPDDAELFVCCEVEDIRLEAIIDRLADNDPAVSEMATRVHTRTDVAW